MSRRPSALALPLRIHIHTHTHELSTSTHTSLGWKPNSKFTRTSSIASVQIRGFHHTLRQHRSPRIRSSREMASSAWSAMKQRRFAPLDPSRPNPDGAPRLCGIVFDVDGTLCLPQNYMFREMRAALDIPKSTDILDHITSLSPEPDRPDDSSPRSRAQEAIKQIERNAMSSQQPQPGLNELLTYLASRGLRLALCTRNFELPVKHLLEKFVDEEARRRFYPLITRETDGVLPKPSPQGVWACVEAWQRMGRDEGGAVEVEVDGAEAVSEEEKMRLCEGVIMVGDSVDDVQAGASAGAATVVLLNEDNEHLMQADEWPKRVDLGIRRLDELIEVLEEGFCGR